MTRFIGILIVTLVCFQGLTQVPGFDPYLPQKLNDTWKFAADVYFADESNSNAFSNEFVRKVNGSEYLDSQLKNDQIGQLSGSSLTGSIREIGGNLWFRKNNTFFVVGMEHQHVLDAAIDEDLLKLLLLGNRPFSGKILEVPSSDYYSIYFTQLKLGTGFTAEKNGLIHSFFGNIAFNVGQNYDELSITNASFYTDPSGDFLDINVSAEARLSDTVWAEINEVNGMGVSAGLFYSVLKEKDYYFAAHVKNLGLISWNKNPFVASMDTTFTFDGLPMDTTNNNSESIPDDFSYDNLRRLVFKNPEGGSFTTTLPVMIGITGGKYFSEGRYYAGINAHIYPTLNALFRLQGFFTFNIQDRIGITPLVSFGSYNKANVGLALKFNAGDHIVIRAGSSYLNSLFSKDALAGSGGFVSLLFIM